jgi:hypothetical protein
MLSKGIVVSVQLVPGVEKLADYVQTVIKPAMAPSPKVTELLNLPEAGLIYPKAACWSVEYEVKRTAEFAPCFMIWGSQSVARRVYGKHSQ